MARLWLGCGSGCGSAVGRRLFVATLVFAVRDVAKGARKPAAAASAKFARAVPAVSAARGGGAAAARGAGNIGWIQIREYWFDPDPGVFFL